MTHLVARLSSQDDFLDLIPNSLAPPTYLADITDRCTRQRGGVGHNVVQIRSHILWTRLFDSSHSHAQHATSKKEHRTHRTGNPPPPIPTPPPPPGVCAAGRTHAPNICPHNPS